jgi:aryl-alcohol dehydrogenase-like predicted oxidoreductase
VGISGVEPGHLDEATAITPVVCVQNSYGLGNRAAEPLVRACREADIAFVPFFAIAGAARHGAPRSDVLDPVRQIARAHDATPAQIRLAWTLQHGLHVLGIPGTGNPAHLTENVSAGAIRFSAAELAALDALPG